MFVVQASSYLLAQRIAEATGGTRVPGAVKPDGTHKATMRVEVGDDFEAVREAVENVTVLFRMFEVTDAGEREVSSGWKVTAAQFEVQWPDDPARACLVRSHFGARRKAFNCALAQVKADMDARKGDGGHTSVQWSLPALRAWWNANKDDLAPWWQDNSKEAYACGIADLVTALDNWKSSKNGTRKGAKVGFPRFKSKRKDRGRVRFTSVCTGVQRVAAHRPCARGNTSGWSPTAPAGWQDLSPNIDAFRSVGILLTALFGLDHGVLGPAAASLKRRSTARAGFRCTRPTGTAGSRSTASSNGPVWTLGRRTRPVVGPGSTPVSRRCTTGHPRLPVRRHACLRLHGAGPG